MPPSNKCANSSCSTVCHHEHDKLFRLEITVGDSAGKSRCRVLYVWLCSRCARELIPKVEVVGDTVTVLLASSKSGLVRSVSPSPQWVN